MKALNGTQIEDIDISCKITDQNLTLSYLIPVEKQHMLDVELNITDYTKHETYYEIKKWQVISTDTWENDDTLNLMPVIK